MDQGELRSLITGGAGETFTGEFKTGSINDYELIEAIACLANGSGGILLVGIDDDGKLDMLGEKRSSSYVKVGAR